MDARKWVDCFAPDAIVDDPVEAAAVIGHAALLEQGEAFVNGFKEIGLHETFVHAAGLEAAAKWEARGIGHDGRDVAFEGINHFVFNAAGKITRLQGFWDPAAVGG